MEKTLFQQIEALFNASQGLNDLYKVIKNKKLVKKETVEALPKLFAVDLIRKNNYLSTYKSEFNTNKPSKDVISSLTDSKTKCYLMQNLKF